MCHYIRVRATIIKFQLYYVAVFNKAIGQLAMKS